MVRLLFFFLLFNAAALRAQQWNWANDVLSGYETIDVAAGLQKQSCVVTCNNIRDYTVTRFDAQGQPQAEHTYYFGQWYGDCVLFVRIDADANIWVLSRQMLDDSAPNDREYMYYSDEETQPERESDFQQYILLEKFTPEFRLLHSQKLIKCAGHEYSVEVNDLEMDAEGNIWFGGNASDAFFFQEEVYTPGPNGGAFLVHVPSDKKFALPWVNLFVSNSNCCQGSIQSFHLAVNNTGTCVVTGVFENEAEFANGVVFKNAPSGKVFGEMFLAAFDRQGRMSWVKRLGAPSDDKDVIALSDGSFVCSGTFSGATRIGKFAVPGGKDYGNFVMRIDAKNGGFKQFYCQDTSSILHLFPGSNGDFYGMFLKGNSGQDFLFYHFDKKFKPEFRTRMYGIEPFCAASSGTLFVGGMWYWLCVIGQGANHFFLGGEMSEQGSVLARWDFE